MSKEVAKKCLSEKVIMPKLYFLESKNYYMNLKDKMTKNAKNIQRQSTNLKRLKTKTQRQLM